MAVKASASVTLSRVVDVAGVTRYYQLVASTASAPAKPTTNPPASAWTSKEPGYDGTTTSTLYFTDLTVLSDGTFSYSDVSKSSSYEAAKQAYNKAAAAQTTANSSLANVTVEYAVGTSATTAPTSGWSSATPTWESGKYVWQRTGTKANSASAYTYTYACIQGAKGDKGDQGEQGIQGVQGVQGDKGDKGDPGDKGDSVTEVAVTYGLSTSNASDGYSSVTSWTTDIPDWETGKYIWQKSVTTIGTTAQAPVYALYGAFNSLASTVDGHTSLIKQQGDSIALKANSADVAEISPNWIKDPSFANGSANTDMWSGSHTWSTDGMICSERDSYVDSCSIDKAKRVYADQKLYMTLTADMSGLTDGTSCNLGFRIANADKEWKGWPTPLRGGSTTRGTNETISMTYAVPSDYDGYYFLPFIQLAATTTTTATGTAVIKHVQITDVTGANSYTDAQIKVSADSITSTVASTYETKSDVANVGVGGRNLLTGTESGEGWLSTYLADSSGEPYNASAEQPTASTATDTCTSYYIAVSPSTQYTLSVNETFSHSGYGRVCCYDSSKAYLGMAIDFIYPSAATSWTFTTPANTAYVRVSAIAVLQHKWKLERGSRATDWTPAPEDVSGDIDAVSSTVATHTTQIKQDADSITAIISTQNTQTEAVSNLQDGVSGNTSALANMQTWLQVNADGLTMGKSDSPYISKMDNEKLGFYAHSSTGDTELASFGANGMDIPSASIDQLTVEPYIMTVRNGHLLIQYGGE